MYVQRQSRKLPKKSFKVILAADVNPPTLPYPLYFYLMNEVHISKLNFRQIFPCQYIHIYSIFIVFFCFLSRKVNWKIITPFHIIYLTQLYLKKVFNGNKNCQMLKILNGRNSCPSWKFPDFVGSQNLLENLSFMVSYMDGLLTSFFYYFCCVGNF